MTYLLDTVVLSNPFLPRPNEAAMSWVEEQADLEMFTSAVCFGELWSGFAGFPDGARRERLEQWLREAERGRTSVRILPVDVEVAMRWGAIVHQLASVGQRPPVADSLIAATALVHNLTVVTRNTRDFERCGVPVLDPWN